MNKRLGLLSLFGVTVLLLAMGGAVTAWSVSSTATFPSVGFGQQWDKVGGLVTATLQEEQRPVGFGYNAPGVLTQLIAVFGLGLVVVFVLRASPRRRAIASFGISMLENHNRVIYKIPNHFVMSPSRTDSPELATATYDTGSLEEWLDSPNLITEQLIDTYSTFVNSLTTEDAPKSIEIPQLGKFTKSQLVSHLKSGDQIGKEWAKILYRGAYAGLSPRDKKKVGIEPECLINFLVKPFLMACDSQRKDAVWPITYLEQLYCGEWIAVDVVGYNKNKLQPVKGRLLYHSNDRADFGKKLRQLEPKDLYVTFSGLQIERDASVA